MNNYYEFKIEKEFKLLINYLSSDINEKYKIGDTVELYNNKNLNKFINKIKDIFNNEKDDSIVLYNKNNILVNYFNDMFKNINLGSAEKILNNIIKYILKLSKSISFKVKIISLIIMIIISIFNITVNDININQNNNKIITKTITYIKSKEQFIKNKNNYKPFKEFLKAIANRESGNNWKSVNSKGYIGKYQFGKIALKDVKYKEINVEEFKNNLNIFPEKIQDELMIKLLKNNKHYLRNYLKYIGSEINGIKITLSGILASAHLVGHKGIKKFLNSNGSIDITDGYGIKCSEYLKKFSNYKIDI